MDSERSTWCQPWLLKRSCQEDTLLFQYRDKLCMHPWYEILWWAQEGHTYNGMGHRQPQRLCFLPRRPEGIPSSWRLQVRCFRLRPVRLRQVHSDTCQTRRQVWDQSPPWWCFHYQYRYMLIHCHWTDIFRQDCGLSDRLRWQQIPSDSSELLRYNGWGGQDPACHRRYP